jgi:hypothetical protein
MHTQFLRCTTRELDSEVYLRKICCEVFICGGVL